MVNSTQYVNVFIRSRGDDVLQPEQAFWTSVFAGYESIVSNIGIFSTVLSTYNGEAANIYQVVYDGLVTNQNQFFDITYLDMVWTVSLAQFIARSTPASLDYGVLYHRPNISTAGGTTQSPRLTRWEDLESICSTIGQKPCFITGLNAEGGVSLLVEMAAYFTGHGVVDLQSGVLNRDGIFLAAKYMAQWMQSNAMDPLSLSLTMAQSLAAFNSSTTLLYSRGWLSTIYYNRSGLSFVVESLPGEYSVMGGQYMGINKHATFANTSVLSNLLDYIVSPNVTLHRGQLLGYIPPPAVTNDSFVAALNTSIQRPYMTVYYVQLSAALSSWLIGAIKNYQDDKGLNASIDQLQIQVTQTLFPSTTPSGDGLVLSTLAIVLIVAGLLLVFGLVGIVLFYTISTRPQNDQAMIMESLEPEIGSSAPATTSFFDSDNPSKIGKVVVLRGYHARESDELSLAPGACVRVLAVYTDRWCYGMRLDDSKEGFFPLDCLGNSIMYRA